LDLIVAKVFLRKAKKGSLREQTQQYLDFIRVTSVCLRMKNTWQRLIVQENTLRQAAKRLSRDGRFLLILSLSLVGHVREEKRLSRDGRFLSILSYVGHVRGGRNLEKSYAFNQNAYNTFFYPNL
jgi:hypothetical protein